MNQYNLIAKSRILDGMFNGFYWLFMFGLFFIPVKINNNLFYLFLLIPFYFFKLPSTFKRFKKSRLLQVAFVYLIYILTSSFWTKFDTNLTFVKAWIYGLYIVGFLGIVVHLWDRDTKRIYSEYYGLIYFGLAAISAVFSIFYFYQVMGNAFPLARLRTVFNDTYPVSSGHLYALALILGSYFYQNNKSVLYKVMYIFGMFACLSALLLTHSRGPMLGLVVAIGVASLFSFRWYFIPVVFLIIGAVLGYDYITGGGFDVLVHRADSGRINIYQDLMNRVEGNEWFGLGLLSDSSSPLGDSVSIYCHSTLLCSYYHGGYVGVTLHVIMLLAAAYGALVLYWRSGSSLYLTFLSFGIFCYSIDGGRLLHHPGTEWLLIWWPIAIIAVKLKKTQPLKAVLEP
ncbi:MAG: hypothetical protein KUG82_17765 [Pseudomonadales bacterium]|nr:hypothetical protein [Pseudomonadales bacterium]